MGRLLHVLLLSLSSAACIEFEQVVSGVRGYGRVHESMQRQFKRWIQGLGVLCAHRVPGVVRCASLGDAVSAPIVLGTHGLLDHCLATAAGHNPCLSGSLKPFATYTLCSRGFVQDPRCQHQFTHCKTPANPIRSVFI